MLNKIYHLTLTTLPHYRVKYEKVQFCKNLHCTFYLFCRNENMSLRFNDHISRWTGVSQ